MRAPSLLPALALAAACLLAAPAHAAWPTDPWSGLPVCTAANDQYTNYNQAASDGAGGAFIAWSDYRGGVSNTWLYVSRVTANGAIAPGWPVDGLQVCGLSGYRSITAVIPGASGDVYLVWDDYRAGNYDIYAQRVLANGTIAPGWPANGLALTNDSRGQVYSKACTDGAGGIYVTWLFQYSGTDYDVYLTRVLPGGTFASGFGINGNGVNTNTGFQEQPDVAPDGSGNVFVLYRNYDGTYYNPWVAKVGPSGAFLFPYPGRDVAPTFTQSYYGQRIVPGAAGGAIVGCNINGSPSTDGPVFVFLDGSLNFRQFVQPTPSSAVYEAMRDMVPDGAGGVYVTATQNDSPLTYYYSFLDHITSSGAAVPAWPGDYLFNEPISQRLTLAAGAGGTLIAAWSRTGNSNDVQAQSMNTTGSYLWPTPYVGQGNGDQSMGSLLPDATGGAIVTWSDARTGGYDVYAAKVDRFGVLGDAAPAITRIADVPNDNGGQVSLQWTPSYLDAGPDYRIARYSVWRRVPGGTLAARLKRGATTLDMSQPRPADATSVIRVERDGAQVIGWEYVADYPARGYPNYSAVVPTTSDSLGSGNPRTSLRVQAETTNGIPFWDSAPDSGYSVDNLPPVAPAPFTGTYAAGTATLAWQANAETDMGTYRLYRGTSSAFTPGPANLVVEQAGTGYTDAAGGPYWYKLAAVDMHGNVSPYTTLLPTGTTDAGPALPRELAFARPTPNPARAYVDLRFALPREAEVRLDVYDATGRRVRTVASGRWAPGEYTVRWDGRDASGAPAGPGLYFVRFGAEGRLFQDRVALLR